MLCVFPSKAPCWVVCRKFRQTTFSFKFVYTLSTHLYPHTHEGCDSMSIPCSSHQERFQSTHPRRVWLLGTRWCSAQASVSIHTPTKGVTRKYQYLSVPLSVSIHTPTKGVTERFNLSDLEILFQSTHPRRVWQAFCKLVIGDAEFQSTHPRRVWRFIR